MDGAQLLQSLHQMAIDNSTNSTNSTAIQVKIEAEVEVEMEEEKQYNTFCVHYCKGRCNYGDNCIKLHPVDAEAALAEYTLKGSLNANLCYRSDCTNPNTCPLIHARPRQIDPEIREFTRYDICNKLTHSMTSAINTYFVLKSAKRTDSASRLKDVILATIDEVNTCVQELNDNKNIEFSAYETYEQEQWSKEPYEQSKSLSSSSSSSQFTKSRK